MDEITGLKVALFVSLAVICFLCWRLKRAVVLMNEMYDDLTGMYARCHEASDRLINSQKEYIAWLNDRIWEMTPTADREVRLKELEAEYRARGFDITEILAAAAAFQSDLELTEAQAEALDRMASRPPSTCEARRLPPSTA